VDLIPGALSDDGTAGSPKAVAIFQPGDIGRSGRSQVFLVRLQTPSPSVFTIAFRFTITTIRER
jgi:hypothetical protein